MLIVFTILGLFVVCATVIATNKKIYKRFIAFGLLILLIMGLIMFVRENPFAKIEDAEVSKITDFTVLEEGDVITLQTTSLKLDDNTVAFDKCYRINDLPDNCIYLFIDEDNRLYYLEEERVVIVKLHTEGGIESGSQYFYPAKIIVGEYESVYAEKSVIRNKTTPWVVATTISTEYTFYIPSGIAE